MLFLAVGCVPGGPAPFGPRPVAETSGVDEPEGVDAEGVESLCADIETHIDVVDTAAESLEQDLLVDGVPFQDQHYTDLDQHLLDVEALEELLSRDGPVRELTERADAVHAVLVELDFGDEPGLAKALSRVADTRDPILEFCAV
nr:hypothetical protein [Nocardiopsis sp. SBT366]